MKKKKAFTLIELLAVIVILAVILIIAVPRITDTIEKSKKGAIESSAKLIARDLESKYATSFATGNVSTSGSCMEGLNTNEYSSCTYEIDNNGKASITLTGSGKFEGYTCTGNKNDMTCEGGEVSGNTLTIQEALDMGLVWYDIDDNSVAIGLRDAQIPALHQNFTTLEIPSKIGNKKVVSIGDSAFQGCDSLVDVKIPNSVTSIGDYAFAYCENLENVEIPNSVTSIGGYAFGDTLFDANLEYDSNDLIILGSVLYRADSNITEVEIPNGITSIAAYAFDGCESLTGVTIPNSVTSIGEHAINNVPWWYNMEYDENGLKIINGILIEADRNISGDITIPNTIRSIGDYAFAWCENLTSVTIPSSVTSIGDAAFYDCGKLTSVTIPSSVIHIGEDAFEDCDSITSMIIPGSVRSIGKDAFQGCDNLASVTIQNGVTSIGNNAFYYCDNLISVTIPNSVTNIGTDAFDGTLWVQNLDYDENGLIILGSVLHAIDPEISGSITIPNSVTSMREGAFYGLENLTNVTFSANKFYTLNNEFNDTTWFTNNSSNGYIIGSNYLVRSVEEYSSR